MRAQPDAQVRLRRAIERRALWMAEDAARELPNLPLEDALQLVHLYAERGSPKYEKAALRWLERYLTESSPRLQDFAYRAMGRLSGTTPVSQVLAWLHEQDARGTRHHWLDLARSIALAMVGRFDEAWTIMNSVRARVADYGHGFDLALVLTQEIDTALLAGDPAAAAEAGSEAVRLYDEFGARAAASSVAGRVGQALYQLDRLEEAESWASRSAELGASDDALTQMLWRQVKAKVLARRGDHAEAERLAREALAIGEETDLLNSVADGYADLGEVLALAGRADEAAAAIAEAPARYERKENLAMAERTRARLAENPA